MKIETNALLPQNFIELNYRGPNPFAVYSVIYDIMKNLWKRKGADIFEDSFAVRQKIVYLPESVPLYSDMRVNEYLRFRGGLKGMRGSRLRERMDVVLGQCQLSEQKRSIIGNLSKGFRQRVGLADCLLHEPECLILDEPTIGLDPNQIRNIRELIRQLSEQYTVLISTHILPEVEMLCERVLIMDAGRIVASDTPAALVGLIKGGERVVVEVTGASKDVIDAFKSIAGVESVVHERVGDWNRLECQCVKGSDARSAMFETVCSHKWQLRELAVEHRKLEDVFVAITHGELSAESDEQKPESDEQKPESDEQKPESDLQKYEVETVSDDEPDAVDKGEGKSA